MKKPKAVDPMAAQLTSMKKNKQIKPTMRFRVSVGHDYGMDNSFRKEEAKRLRKEIKEIEDRLMNLNDKEAAKEMRRALRQELTHKKARHAEHKTYLDAEKEGEDD